MLSANFLDNVQRHGCNTVRVAAKVLSSQMLSAYAALRERHLSPTENDRNVETETDSEEDIASTAAEASAKRRPSPKTVLPSRKRRKGNQETRYFAEAMMEASNEASYVPTRGYSPSDPVPARDVDMLETVHS